MKTLTLAATLAAVSLTFGAAPAFAENAVEESQRKIEKALNQHDAAPHSKTRATTFGNRNNDAHTSGPLTSSERAHKRLFKFRSPPSGK